MRYLVSVVIFAPAAGAFALMLAGAERSRLVRSIAIGAATLTMFASLLLWVRFQPRGPQWQFVDELDFLSGRLTYSVGVDGLAVLFLCLASTLGWMAVAWSSVDVTTRVKEHFSSLLLLQTGLNGVFASLSLVQLFLFWLIALVAMWVIVGIRDQGPRRLVARSAALYTAGASAAVLTSILVLEWHVLSVTGTWTSDVRTLQRLTFPLAYQVAAYTLFMLGFMATAGVFPFHRWFVRTVAKAPFVVSMLLASVVVKLGTFGVLRIALPMLPDAARIAALAIFVVAVLPVFLAVIMLGRHADRRTALAYGSQAYVGLMFGAAFALAPRGLTNVAISQVSHGLLIAAMFVAIRINVGRTTFPVISQPVSIFRRLSWALVLMLAPYALLAPPFMALQPTIETSIARIVLRVSPERAAEVADCLANAGAPPPVPADSALPADMFMAAPCADGQAPPKSSAPK
jgi:NADH-quinone oxidoreductase subunit M